MTTTPAPTIPVTDDGALTQRWADLLPPGPSSDRTLWLAWLRLDGMMVPTVVPVEELPERPSSSIVSGLLALHDAVADAERRDPDDLHLTLVLQRPDRLGPEPTESDEEWFDLLQEVVVPVLDQGCSFHLYDGRSVRQWISRPVWPRLP